MDYTDSIDPEHWKLEQQAIFRKTWLHVGRVERLPKTGSYFTWEMPSVGAGTSIIVVKDKEGTVRAFYNMCRHRGNKLVWNDFPGEEVSGSCRQFTCKYHAWRFALNGDLTFIQQEDEFFDVDKADFGPSRSAARSGRASSSSIRRRRRAPAGLPPATSPRDWKAIRSIEMTGGLPLPP